LQLSAPDIEKGVKDAEAALATQLSVVEASTGLFVDATAAANTCANTLAVKRAEQQASTSKLASVIAEKGALESILESAFLPMKAGAIGDQFENLKPHLKNLGVEESLLIALPSTCAKLKEERGSFDFVILDELEKAFSSRIHFLGDSVAEEKRLLGEHEAAALGAQEECNVKHDTLKQSAEELEAAKEKQRCLEAACVDAKRKADAFQPEVEGVMGLIKKLESVVADFETGPMASFERKTTGESAAADAAHLGA